MVRADEPRYRPEADRQAVSQRRIQMHLVLRLLMAVFVLLIALILQFRRFGQIISAALEPLYVFSAVLFVLTILAGLFLERARRLVPFAYSQVLFDVLAVTLLVYISGGVDSLFSFLYMPIIICAAVLLGRKASFWTAAMATVVYGFLIDSQYFGWIHPLPLMGGSPFLRDSATYFYALMVHIPAFFLVAFLSGHLAEELSRSAKEIHRHRRDLARMEDLYRNIVGSMANGLFTVDASGKITYVNDAASRIMGMPKGRLVGTSFEVLWPGILPSADSQLQGVHSPSSGEVEYQRPDGERRELVYTLSRLASLGEGDDGGWVFLFHDQTEHNAVERHVKRLQQLAFVGKMAAEIVHEIKNPLAAISGAVQILEMEEVSDSIDSRLIAILQRETDRINELVTKFLWLARGGAKGNQNEEAVEVGRIVDEVLDALQVHKRLGPQHHVRVGIEKGVAANVPSSHLRQILWHVILNALEAQPQGGRIRIEAHPGTLPRESTPCLILSVTDDGPGIAEEDRDRIFDPFFTTKAGATGLGLSIVYRLVEECQGRIQCRSESPGTSMVIFLPAA